MIHKNKKVKISDNFPLNIAISIAGIFLLGFIYSFSKNATKQGIPIKVTFPKTSNQSLAIDVYEKNPIQNIKIEVLNGCGDKGVADLYANYLRGNNYDVIDYKNADNFNYNASKIIVHNNNLAVENVAELFDINSKNVDYLFNENIFYDMTLIIGRDYKQLESFENVSKYYNSY